MSDQKETFNRDLYDLLKVRGFKPVSLDSKNQRVPASQEADVIQFTFVKDGKDYGKAWVTLDSDHNVIIYYDEEQQHSPNNPTPGLQYDDTWTGLLKHVKNWSQRRQLSFELKNKDHLHDDMTQREYYKMKAKLGESYNPMGKKSSFTNVGENVKVVLQHNRSLEEGERRYGNVARIFLENTEGERFLVPTKSPGIAQVYARHIAEGGIPNDERWNHIKSLAEDYSKMGGFVRATRNKQFNESTQLLVQEGINHHQKLRETLGKLRGHRGYNAYFESWSPSLMEDGTDIDLSEMFVSSEMDPRIESAMPILSKLHKPVTEMAEIDSLAEWADNIISEKLELNEFDEGITSNNPQGIPEAEDKQGDEYKKWRKKNFNDKKTTDDIVKDSGTRTKFELNELSADTVDRYMGRADKEATQAHNTMKSLDPRSNKATELKKKFKQRGRGLGMAAKKLGGTAKVSVVTSDEVEEGLDANQKRVGQLGPTEKVKNNNIGKLVGACESVDKDDLQRIIDITKYH